MRHFLLILLFLVSSLLKAGAQSSGNEIVGKWKVVEMKVDPAGLSKTEVQKAEVFKNSFLKSTFVFKSDKNFSFNIDIKDIKVNNGHWKYDPESKSYIIQEWKDKDKDGAILMEIRIVQVKDEIFFLLPDLPFKLEVKKED